MAAASRPGRRSGASPAEKRRRSPEPETLPNAINASVATRLPPAALVSSAAHPPPFITIRNHGLAVGAARPRRLINGDLAEIKHVMLRLCWEGAGLPGDNQEVNLHPGGPAIDLIGGWCHWLSSGST